MPKFTEEFWRRVRATYVESWQDGTNLSLDGVARLFEVDAHNLKQRASRDGWANDARIAAAMGKAIADTNAILGPAVREEVVTSLDSPEVSGAIQRRADAAVDQAVETKVRPVAVMMEAHSTLIQDGLALGAALMALGVDSLPDTGEEALRQGWTPTEILRALDLAWKFREAGMRWERTLHGLPSSVRVSQSSVEAHHTFQGVGNAVDLLGDLTITQLAEKLKAHGVSVPDTSVIDAEWTVEEVDTSGNVSES